MKLWIARLLGLSYEEKLSLFNISERLKLCARFNVPDDRKDIREEDISWKDVGVEVAEDGALRRKPGYYTNKELGL